ncbi:peptide deformylase [Wenxinia saemankumensis]|uniref:Peptide deformylase n=1 Tax=Wenxinia saemankumensis TaxID=1447782 RepID=A0A1M6EHE9_9RHOB|nr:peptide deformylase [Wenxinia saemankumensis]SHI84750.1 peptide deformylase [Wenxinia saemankumensis]
MTGALADEIAGQGELSIRLVPDPVLRELCDPVTRFGPGLSALADAMLRAMYAAPGRGLAAPQVGRAIRLFVVDTAWKEGAPAPMIFVNPVVMGLSVATEVVEEGCLSIPDTPCRVRRPVRVDLAWQEVDGTPREGRFEGIAARCILHELDHLDGILCTDRAEEAAA